MGAGKGTHREKETDKHIHRRGKDERSRVLGLFLSPKLHPRRSFQALEKKGETQQGPDLWTVSPPGPQSVCV